MALTNGAVSSLPAQAFDAVVLSLVLSYMPSPAQRYRCCAKARGVLKPGGLLLLVHEDSNHVTKGAPRMQRWRAAIESLGFRRCKYTKLTHLHCLAFRAVTPEFAPPLDPCAQGGFWRRVPPVPLRRYC